MLGYNFIEVELGEIDFELFQLIEAIYEQTIAIKYQQLAEGFVDLIVAVPMASALRADPALTASFTLLLRLLDDHRKFGA